MALSEAEAEAVEEPRSLRRLGRRIGLLGGEAVGGREVGGLTVPWREAPGVNVGCVMLRAPSSVDSPSSGTVLRRSGLRTLLGRVGFWWRGWEADLVPFRRWASGLTDMVRSMGCGGGF